MKVWSTISAGHRKVSFHDFQNANRGRMQSPIDISEPITFDPDAKIYISNSWNVPRKYEILFNAGHERELSLFHDVIKLN